MEREKFMEIYDSTKRVPETAMKTIGAGRLKGMTDINPMWRIKTLTAMFGPCGIGWWYEIINQRTEPIEATGETAVFVDINLYYKYDGEESHPIPGTGGSKLVTSETKGLYADDEAFKKALTDAISVAAKALGVGADVYFSKDSTKYTTPDEPTAPVPTPPQKITYEEALEFVMPDTVHQGRTLREIFKSSRGDVQIIYNTTQDSRAREAINAVYDGIKRANEAKKASAVNLAEVS